MTAINSVSPAIADRPSLPADPLPLDRLGRVDTDAIGREITALAAQDPAAALARFNQAAPALTPVQTGELMRETMIADIPLPSVPEIPGIPTLPRLPGLPRLPSAAELARMGTDQLERLADAVSERLAALPHGAADALADSMRGDRARPLTPDERSAVRAAYGNRVDLDNVRIVNGAGYSPAAHAAFRIGGNPAITIGDTIYLAPRSYSSDLGQPGAERELLLHEFAHVVQYEEMGYGSFGAKYASDLAAHGGDRNAVYRYDERQTTFAQETIEGQAEMVGDYARVRESTRPEDQAKIRDLERRLEGTGIYGL